ncbi:hypothetical protein GALMADRAFT_221933 [Galerina marginata CBS 339.88]|uniref:Piwi domain-containing protein n=1 Tax=Galerina marginata (strain CBS 339.88) TaxID=685588 RepID=A0A067TFY5_GALM3|nr:hypothetical protein GALMADRAFT_221933 [Galerina marginata CBS 339.88]
MSRHPQAGPSAFQQVLLTNAFEIVQLPTKTYYQYDVFDPSEKIRNKRIQLINHLQSAVAPTVFNPRALYDGQAIAYSPAKLPLAANGSGTFVVKLGVTTSTPPGTKGSYQIRLTLTAGGEIHASHLDDLIKSKKSTTRALVATNLVQLVVRQGPNQHHTNNGRAYFTGRERLVLGKTGLEAWRGIFQSVRPTLGKMILTVDTCTAVVYQGGSLMNRAMEYLGTSNANDLNMNENDVNFRKLETFLPGTPVRIKTGNGRSRTKIIRGLISRAGEYEFLNGDQETTVAAYFRDTYNMTITRPLSVGVSLAKKDSPHQDVVPIELCTVEPGRLYKRRIPESCTSAMVNFSTLKPKERLKKITDAVRDHNLSEFLREAGMRVNMNPMTINAKLLTAPAVYFNLDSPPTKPKSGGWNTVGQSFTEPQMLEHWIIVNFVERISEQQAHRLLTGLMVSCKNLDPKPRRAYLRGIGHDVPRTLSDAMDMAARTYNNGKIEPKQLSKLIIIVLLPENGGQIRNALKFWGDVRHGIATLCLREAKVFQGGGQYFNNVALKLNARLGGINFHSISPAMEEILLDSMIMGADVGHPGPGVHKPSVVGIVYSHDRYAAQYAALTGIQPPRVEQILDLKRYVSMAVDSFGAKNRAPKRLIFFRDGLSEGEYERVARQEITDIKGACIDLWASKGIKIPIPALTFIVVGKRHHAVFFPSGQGQGDRTGNCHAGSLIDNTITHPAVNDFYLQSHAAIQGTSRSSHYVVLHDENFGDRLDKIQDLSFTLCHMYAKATRSVSIPAPVYCEFLVCSRGGFHVDPSANFAFDDNASTTSSSSNLDMSAWQAAFRPINPRLNKTMYFL